MEGIPQREGAMVRTTKALLIHLTRINMTTINGVKSKVFSKPKPSKDDIIVMNPTDTHLIKDTKKRTAQRNELDTMSRAAIGAGMIALLAVLWYAGAVVDAIIGVILI